MLTPSRYVHVTDVHSNMVDAQVTYMYGYLTARLLYDESNESL